MNHKLQEPETPSLSNKKRPQGVDIFLGLLMAIGLNLLQVFLLSQIISVWGKPVAKSNFIIFFFGFTQLLYLLPTILYFKRRHHRGLMIGLIIGASLTFLLGLPIAGLGYLCATGALHL